MVINTMAVSAQAMLEEAPWRILSWRRGTKGRLKARFAARRVRVADGPPPRIGALGVQHLPGEEVWLIGEHRSNGDRKYYLSNLSADTSLTRLAGAIKARWIVLDYMEARDAPAPWRWLYEGWLAACTGLMLLLAILT